MQPALTVKSSPIRLATASLIGTVLEWYDFAMYNTLSALIFAKVFFPNFDPLVGIILSFSTYVVGYVSRPLGGFIAGHVGDIWGRKIVLIVTLIFMGVTTGLMGLLPTYAQIGIYSPILLVILRFLQGVALGGEWAGAVLLAMEHSDPRKRGFHASWAQMGPSGGTVLATGVLAIITGVLSAEEFETWGWRIPFLFSLLLVILGFWVRRGVAETPAFEALARRKIQVRLPIVEVFRHFWKQLLLAGGSRIGVDILYALTTVFVLSYATTSLHLERKFMLNALMIGAALNFVSVPLFGALSDRLGRRPVYLGCAVLAILWVPCFLYLVDTVGQNGNFYGIVLAIGVSLVLHAGMYGVQAAFIVEQFPTRVRYAGASLAYTLAGVLGGAFAPLLMATFHKMTGNTSAVLAYVCGALLITSASVWAARETAHDTLE